MADHKPNVTSKKAASVNVVSVNSKKHEPDETLEELIESIRGNLDQHIKNTEGMSLDIYKTWIKSQKSEHNEYVGHNKGSIISNDQSYKPNFLSEVVKATSISEQGDAAGKLGAEADERIETEGESDDDSGVGQSIVSSSTAETQNRSTTPNKKIADPWIQTGAANKDKDSFKGDDVGFDEEHCSVSSESQERLTTLEKKAGSISEQGNAAGKLSAEVKKHSNLKVNRLYNVDDDKIKSSLKKKLTEEKQSIVDCDSKETMARVRELVEKMISRQLDNLEELKFRFCDLKKEHLEEFLLEAVACKISKLSIGFTEKVTDLIPSYCQIASNYKSTNLSLVFNDLKNKDIEALLENLYENDKYMELDMSHNKSIEPDGYETVGKIVQKHEVRTLRLADCNISDDDLHKLFDGMGDAKLEELDISCTDNVTAIGFAHTGKQVVKNGITRLKLSDTQLNVETLTAFYEEVIKDSKGQPVLVEEIDVSYNSTMEPKTYKVLGSMVELFGVKKLSLAACGLKKKHLENFRKQLNSENSINETGQHTKMKYLNAGDNTSIGKGIVEIAEIVKECQLEELDISECRFSVNELEEFKKTLGNAKLKCLYLGEKRQFDKNYISQVCNLLPHIKETLRLRGTVRNHLRSILQDKLNILRESKLEIQLDEDVTLRAQIKDEITNSS